MITALAGAALIAGGYLLLSDQWDSLYAVRWAALASAVLGYVLFIVWRGLPQNHRRTETQILANLGLGNALTIARGLMLALIGGFLFSPWPGGWLAWAPGLLYTVADVLDYFDGFAARVTKHTTQLGTTLDLEFDALGVLIVPLLAVLYGQLPVWYLAASAARYLFAFGLWWRKRRGLPVYDLTPSIYRRHMAGFLMGLVGVVLWPVFFPPGTWVAATVYVVPFLALFLRDWLVVSGRLNPQSARYAWWMDRMEELATRWLPVAMRLAVLAIGGWIALTKIQAGMDLPGLWIGLIIVAILITVGIAGRIMGLVMLGLIGFGFPPHEVNIVSVLIATATGISLLGTGPASLWQPEDRYFIGRQFGGDE